jgi:hypothetical protein
VRAGQVGRQGGKDEWTERGIGPSVGGSYFSFIFFYFFLFLIPVFKVEFKSVF